MLHCVDNQIQQQHVPDVRSRPGLSQFLLTPTDDTGAGKGGRGNLQWGILALFPHMYIPVAVVGSRLQTAELFGTLEGPV